MSQMVNSILPLRLKVFTFGVDQLIRRELVSSQVLICELTYTYTCTFITKTIHCSDLNMRRELFHGNLSVTKDLLCCEVSSRDVSWEEWFCVYNIRWILYHRLFEIIGSFFYRIRIIDLCNFLGCIKSYQRYWWVSLRRFCHRILLLHYWKC